MPLLEAGGWHEVFEKPFCMKNTWHTNGGVVVEIGFQRFLGGCNDSFLHCIIVAASLTILHKPSAINFWHLKNSFINGD